MKEAAAAREAELNLKLEDHAHKVSDRDALNEQVLQLQRDIQLAQITVAEVVRLRHCYNFIFFSFSLLPFDSGYNSFQLHTYKSIKSKLMISNRL